MIWALCAVICSSLVYLYVIMTKYSRFIEGTQPKIKQLKERNGKLYEAISNETKLSRGVREQGEEVRVSISNLKMDISNFDRQLLEAKQAEEQIEMKSYKKQFNRDK
jgi:hypothetical protein